MLIASSLCLLLSLLPSTLFPLPHIAWKSLPSKGDGDETSSPLYFYLAVVQSHLRKQESNLGITQHRVA